MTIRIVSYALTLVMVIGSATYIGTKQQEQIHLIFDQIRTALSDAML